MRDGRFDDLKTGSSAPISDGVAALLAGRLDWRRVLRKALQADASLRAWLDRRTAESRGSARVPSQSGLASAAVRAARRRFGRRRGVVSIHWGARRKAGRFTGQECVVVSLEGKAPRHHLRAGQRLPGFLEVDTRRGVAKVRVDVQGAGGPGRLLAGVRPGAGFRIRALGNEIAFGTLSGFQEGDGQPSGVLLSGHVAERVGRALEVRGFGRVYDLGSVSKIVPVADGDIALGSPLPADAEDLGLAQSVHLRDQTALHIHMLVKVLTWREPNGLQTHITARERDARFRHQGTDVRVRNLIGLHGVAADGDSGAPVVDLKGNLLGFVVGEYSGETMVMPARRALDALRAAR